jgi:outer membrane PBP1 activator LpoA protein
MSLRPYVLLGVLLLTTTSTYAQQPTCEQLLDAAYTTAQTLLQQVVQSKAQLRAEYEAKLASLKAELTAAKKSEVVDEKSK